MPQRWSARAAGAQSALHAKTVVFDRESVWIGSFNLDPRSWKINTEIGVMIDSPEIARQVAEYMDEGVSAGSAYHLTLDERASCCGQRRRTERSPSTTPIRGRLCGNGSSSASCACYRSRARSSLRSLAHPSRQRGARACATPSPPWYESTSMRSASFCMPWSLVEALPTYHCGHHHRQRHQP